MEHINLLRKEKLQEKDLTLVCWEECRTYFLQEYPEFVFWAQAGFSERSEILSLLRRKSLNGRHEQIMADYRNTYTKERLELKNIVAKL